VWTDARQKPAKTAQAAAPAASEQAAQGQLQGAPRIIEKKEGFCKIEMTELAKCGICMGKIKPGATAFECDCGIFYHEPCAKRAGKCQNCGVDLSK
jgi:hypothetical protein